jgi:hypothetical protein
VFIGETAAVLVPVTLASGVSIRKVAENAVSSPVEKPPPP